MGKEFSDSLFDFENKGEKQHRQYVIIFYIDKYVKFSSFCSIVNVISEGPILP